MMFTSKKFAKVLLWFGLTVLLLSCVKAFAVLRLPSFLAAVAGVIILWFAREYLFKGDEYVDMQNNTDQQLTIAAQDNIEIKSSLPEEWKQQKSKKLRKKRPVKARVRSMRRVGPGTLCPQFLLSDMN
uniref:Uncharacterized protein n=1 Tax=Ditylenchus dipsaci TaxID=166011 RepID=A0A915E0C5_9BILA